MAAGATYSTIATTTLGAAQNVVTFSSISQSYTDLVLVISNSRTGATYMRMRINSDIGQNYSYTYLYGFGTSAYSGRLSNATAALELGYQTANVWGQAIIQLQNYSNTTTNKTVLARTNDGQSSTWAYVGLWRSTAAINSIMVYPFSGANFDAGSTFTLYGIASA